MKPVLLATLVLATSAFAQDKPVLTTVPKLKPEVQLAITQQQLTLTQAAAQEQQIIQQYKDLEQAKSAAGAKITELEKTALKDSGINESLYMLDPNSLEVVAKPPAPAKK